MVSVMIKDIEKEFYLDQLSGGLLDIQEMIENIEGSGLSEDEKKEALCIMTEKYNKLHKVFQKTLREYID
jgi:hypothetical protein